MKKNNFLQSLTVLASGSMVALIVQALAQILFAKVFSPETLGIFGFLLAVPNAFVGVVSARYDAPLVYEEDENNIFALIKLNVILSFIISSVVSIGAVAYFCFFKTDYKSFLWTIPVIWVYLFANGLTCMLNSYNNRNKEYKMITKMYVLRTMVQNLGSLVLGVLIVSVFKVKSEALSIAILLVPYSFGMICGLFSQGKILFEQFDNIKSVPRSKVIQVAKKHFKQPLMSSPAVFANNYSYSLITIAVEGFGKAAAGFYSLSTKLLGMPISLISGNISKIFLEEASREFNNTGKFRKSFNKTFLFLLVCAVPLFFCLYFLAPTVCGWLFGKAWIEAGEYIKVLSLMFSFRFVSTALSVGLYACRKQQTELIVQFAFLLATVLCGVYSSAKGLSVVDYLALVGTVRSVVMFFQIFTVFVYSRGFGMKNAKINQDSSGENA